MLILIILAATTAVLSLALVGYAAYLTDGRED
jgi:hypothetical protein